MILLQPSVVVLSGPPLMGKTFLAIELTRQSNLFHLDVDGIRERYYANKNRPRVLASARELFEMTVSYTHLVAEGLYLVGSGQPVVLSGTFSKPQFKAPLELLYRTLLEDKIPFHALLLNASDDAVARRIEKRKSEGGISPIDSLEKFRRAKGFFQPITFAPVVEADTEGDVAEVAARVLLQLTQGFYCS